MFMKQVTLCLNSIMKKWSLNVHETGHFMLKDDQGKKSSLNVHETGHFMFKDDQEQMKS